MTTYEIEIDDDAPPALSSEEPVDGAQLDALADGALDELSFGVILLGPTGIIERYNLAEARLARLDRAVVRGRSFFGEVAPCTARPEFQGRVDSFLAENRPDGERFSYVFDFSFGAQVVAVELRRCSRPGSVYLLVNRSEVLGIRAEAFRPAPALEHWEGPSAPGVVRDDRSQRVVKLPVSALGKLMRVVQRLGVDQGKLLEEWGTDWGRRAAIELEARALEERGRSLRVLRIGDAVDVFAEAFAREGWGALVVDFANSTEHGAIVVRVTRSVWQDALGLDAPAAARFTESYVAAVLTYLAGRRLLVKAALPDRRDGAVDAGIDLIVVAESRRAALLAASADGRASLAEILRSLGTIAHDP